ncbi:SGNH/GDSL hydrolase family protein [Chryseomicrobium aureum]|uniref:SGNH/GDSL hydrolase family protein n=1 Tax=Chryseomicrobium aureum TaxID=1441723 RepID=UPI00370D3CF1
MPAEKIKYSDNLKQGTDKLNSAIEAANTAETLSTNADTKATQALSNSVNTQEQLDTIVIEGDSSVEAAQARVPVEGTAYPTLKARLDAENQNLTAQLDDKLDKDTTNLSLNNFNETDRSVIQGLAPGQINAVLGYKNVKPENASFFKTGKNLFDKSKAVIDKFVNSVTGALDTSTSYYASDFMPVESGAEYVQKYSYHLAYYDVNKNYVSGMEASATPESPRVITIPANVRYTRMTVLKAHINIFQFEKGNVSSDFEAFYEVIPKEVTEKHPFTSTDIPNGSLKANQTEYLQLGKNLFDKSVATSGYYVNQADGTLAASALHTVSDFISVFPDSQYRFDNDANSRIAFYNENQVFISGILNPTMPITTPSNTVFIRFSFTTSPETQQFEAGSIKTSYESFGIKFPKLITSDIGEDVVLNLPSKLYGLVGKEVNIYFDNIISGKDTDYDFEVVSSKGMQLGHVWRFVPDVAESRPVTINVYKNGKLVASADTTVIVSATSVGSGITKRMLTIGDSTVNSQGLNESGVSVNNLVSRKLLENFSSDVMGVESLGTLGASPNNHEGRSGWTAKNYLENASIGATVNAFLNPATSTFDFSYYMSNSSIAVPDYVVINLGINDVFSLTTDEAVNAEIELIKSRYDTMIASIKAYSSTIKIGIAVTIPPNYSQDAFGKAYNSGQTRTRYKRNNMLWVRKLIASFKGREAELIYLIPLNVNIDTRYNYGIEQTAVNARNSETYASPVANGGVHPVLSGYWQVADTYWYWLKSFEL